MEDLEDWSVDCSDDEVYSSWQSIRDTNGRAVKIPPHAKVAELYSSIESGQIDDKLKWRRQVTQIEPDFIYPCGLYTEDLIEMAEKHDVIPDSERRNDCLVNADDDFGFQDDHSETGIEIYHQRSRAKKERIPVSTKASVDRILRSMKRNRE